METTRIEQLQELWKAHKKLAENIGHQSPGSHYDMQQQLLAESVGFLLDNLRKLSFNEYQNQARTTAIYPKEHAIDYCTMKLGSEAGEVSGKVAKRYRDDDGRLTEDRIKGIKKEIGDVLWYVAMLSYELGFSLEDVAQSNLDWLSGRAERGTLKGDGDLR